jgi:glycosyltransferase involved in cell wall biosynthesis
MTEVYVDASQVLRWGPLPPVGIPRVETAVVRQALAQRAVAVQLFLVERDGAGRMLSRRERDYLVDMIEGRIPALEGEVDRTAWYRLKAALRAVRAGAYLSGREFDRAAAAYVAHDGGRTGWRYQGAKLLVRLARVASMGTQRREPASRDPLSDPGARCFLSKVSLHRLAGLGRESVSAKITTLLHDMIPLDQPGYFEPSHVGKFRRDLDWMFRHCSQVVCVSQWTAERARAFVEAAAPDTRAAISVNPLGSFLSEGTEGKSEEPVRQLVGKSFAVYCSTIEARKNHITLLRAWHKLLPKLGADLPTLVLCGRWGWMVDEAKAFLAEHPELHDKVLFQSGISDRQLAWLYRNARFGLFPSYVEGWGLGAAECLDFGLPVLISDAASLAEATQGLMPVIAADDFDGWCAAIERAATDEAWLALLRASIAAAYKPITERQFGARLLGLMLQPDGTTSTVNPPPAAAGPAREDGLSFPQGHLKAS